MGGHSSGGGSGKLSSAEWTKVVLVAGVGTILEWYDFYIYAQLTSTLKKVFFPKSDPTAQTLLWWAVYAVGFVVRPLGALIFGHIGDTFGRNTTLRIAIVFMAVPTMIIGCLPTYSTGSYTAGIAAPILLTILRLVQGLAMGGEFGPAIIYISELAPVGARGRLVACLQMTVNIGMILATLLVMILENSMSAYNMQIYGWRIPFLLAFCTAILGYYLRLGLPEPKAFLKAARTEKKYLEAQAMAEGKAEGDLATAPSSKSLAETASVAGTDDLREEEFEAEEEKGALTMLHGHHHSKLPIARLLMNNWLGLLMHVMFMAWISGAFYATATWLPAQLRDKGLRPILSQGMVIVAMVFNAMGLYTTGFSFDKGIKAIWLNLGVTIVGLSIGFGVFYGVWTTAYATAPDTLNAWFLFPLYQYVCGIAMAAVALPATRIYAPLERTTGFSFGYNCGYGVIGGLTPFAVSSIIDDLSESHKAYAPAFWLLALGGISVIGCLGMRMYAPRLNKRFIGSIE